MKIELRYFASVREQVGMAAETVDLPPEVSTVGAVRAWLTARGGNWAAALAEGRALRMAHDQVMCTPATVVREGGEVAFFPPVTGG